MKVLFARLVMWLPFAGFFGVLLLAALRPDATWRSWSALGVWTALWVVVYVKVLRHLRVGAEAQPR